MDLSLNKQVRVWTVHFSNMANHESALINQKGQCLLMILINFDISIYFISPITADDAGTSMLDFAS